MRETHQGFYDGEAQVFSYFWARTANGQRGCDWENVFDRSARWRRSSQRYQSIWYRRADGSTMCQHWPVEGPVLLLWFSKKIKAFLLTWRHTWGNLPLHSPDVLQAVSCDHGLGYVDGLFWEQNQQQRQQQRAQQQQTATTAPRSATTTASSNSNNSNSNSSSINYNYYTATTTTITTTATTTTTTTTTTSTTATTTTTTTITAVHSNQDHIWLAKIGDYIGFYVDRRSWLLWSPVILLLLVVVVVVVLVLVLLLLLLLLLQLQLLLLLVTTTTSYNY